MIIEGVSYEINWKRFKRGTSIFIPCLNVRRARAQVIVVTKRLKLKVLIKVVIESGIRGLRIWPL
jgi:hypothetical protein